MKIVIRSTFLVIGLSAFAAFALPASAQRVSPLQAGSFLKFCMRPAGGPVCDGYITGMADAVALSKVNSKNEGDSAASAGFCIPQAETGSAMREKVTTWLKSHSEKLSGPVGEGVFLALHESYPCGSAK